VTDSHDHHFVHPRLLKFNVGFLLAQGAGNQREVEVDLPRVRVADDVELDFLRGTLIFSRNSQGVLVQGSLQTHVLTECSRCLEPMLYPVTLNLAELFAYPPSAEHQYSVEETGNLDLAPLLREEAILAVPMGMLCQPDCAGLCPHCGKNLNDGSCECVSEDLDPRLASLREILDEQIGRETED
jgi:uncharacterized protein